MAKWKWFEKREVINGAVQTEAVDFGWSCGNCGLDLNRYLDASGYMIARGIVASKRNPPKLEYCPRCGEKMEVKNANH